MAAESRFIGLKDPEVREALRGMGIETEDVARVIIDLGWDYAARVYVELFTSKGPVAKIITALCPGIGIVMVDGIPRDG